MKLKKNEVKSGFLCLFKIYMSQFVDEGLISSEQADRMIGTFEIKSRIRFVTAVTVIGAILIGLGILSYIASNWDHFMPTAKVILILFSMVAFYGAGLSLEKEYRKVGKSLQYISIFIYGGGLFLIDQIYNLNLNVSTHFALWIIGVIPMIWIHKDYFMYLFGQVLTIMFCFALLENNYWLNDLKLALMIVLGVGMLTLWIYLNENIYKLNVSTFLNNLIPIVLLIAIFDQFDWNIVIFTAILLLYGLYLHYYPQTSKVTPAVNRIQGIVIMGIAGFMYSFEDLWEEWDVITDGTVFAIVFSIVFMVYLFWLTRQGNVSSLVFICIFILRFYFDTFYDFLPKSIFFIIGGTILLAFGFYLERLTRMKGVSLNVED